MNKQGIYLLALLTLSFASSLSAQTTRAEYWLDADPGRGKATAVNVNPENASIDIPTEALAYGWHIAGIRVQQGRWSQTYTHRFYKAAPQPTEFGELSGAEYWVNTDPGRGRATPIPFTDGQTAFTLDLETDGLEPGFYTVGMRARYGDVWSQTYTHRFFIAAPGPAATELTAAEYWLDNDPGRGLALPLAVTDGQTEIELDVLQTDTLKEGYHTLGLRVRYGDVWSQTYTHRFFRTEKHSVATQIEAIEAYWDADTTHIALVPFTQVGDSVVINGYDFPTDTLSYGLHYLYIHAKANGVWSILNRYEVCKNAIPQFSLIADTICVGEDALIIDETKEVQPTTTYAWDFNGDGKVDDTSAGDQVYTYSKAGKYTITLTIQTGEGCESVYTKDLVVLTKSAPTVQLTRDKKAICEGESVIFTATPTNGGDQPRYTWYKNNVEIAGEKEAQLTLSDLKDKDTIQVKLTTNNKCASSTTALSSKLIQTVYALPEIEFTFAETYYTDENAFSLTGKATPAGGTFYINDAVAKLFNPKTNPVGTYTVRYEVTNNNGCKAEAETTFELKERPIDPTANENITNELIPTKVLINDVIFILRGDKTYTIDGRLVR